MISYYNDGSLFQLILEILSLEGWKFDCDYEYNQIYLEIQGINHDFLGLLTIDEEQESILYYLNIFDKVPYNKRLEICEFINRVNYGLNIGNFELDLETGNIRYRNFLDLENCNPSKEQILNLIWHGVQCFDVYYLGFLSLITEEMTIHDALKYCLE